MSTQQQRPTVFVVTYLHVPGPTLGDETITPCNVEVRVSIPVDAAGAVKGEVEKTVWEARRKR